MIHSVLPALPGKTDSSRITDEASDLSDHEVWLIIPTW